MKYGVTRSRRRRQRRRAGRLTIGPGHLTHVKPAVDGLPFVGRNLVTHRRGTPVPTIRGSLKQMEGARPRPLPHSTVRVQFNVHTGPARVPWTRPRRAKRARTLLP